MDTVCKFSDMLRYFQTLKRKLISRWLLDCMQVGGTPKFHADVPFLFSSHDLLQQKELMHTQQSECCVTRYKSRISNRRAVILI